ncbi:MAG: DUF2927 domain-containing protein [Pseudomonadota bacterium]|nr:DUF2927 domain-containing protein [Pseudomonadota bacterium]
MKLKHKFLPAALVAAGLLSGCDMPGSGAVATAPIPQPRPDLSGVPEADGLSPELVSYYARLQNGLLTQGLLRTDTGGPDAPYTARDLTRNFLKIAFYEEYTDQGGRLVARESASKLHRWDKPVRLTVEFGPSVSQVNRTRDTNELYAFANKLGRATGHPVSVGQNGNFHVFIVSESERRALEPRLRQIMPNISRTALNTVIDLPQTTYCLAFATDPEQNGTYDQAVAIIRAEHPDLLRASCIHEEVAQGMGLSNDYPLARPSIFNDDEEFGFLTTHDEKLLQMLYDERLRPGMRETEARPIVERIAAELMGGNV